MRESEKREMRDEAVSMAKVGLVLLVFSAILRIFIVFDYVLLQVGYWAIVYPVYLVLAVLDLYSED